MNPADPSNILQTAFGFWHSKVLLTAVEFGVFTKLAGRHLTGAELGAELQLHPRAIADFFDALGWGYGLGVSTAPSAIADNVGRYGWDAGFGLSWANDPVSGLIGMMMTQNSGFYAAAPFADFWIPANAALAS